MLACWRDVGLPTEAAYAYHRWYGLAVIVRQDRLEICLDDGPVQGLALEHPVPPGRIGCCGDGNAAGIARATLSRSEP
jgi:hypothetical protein